MSEESGVLLSSSVQPGPRPWRLPPQSFELLHGPPDQMLVDAQCEGVQLGAVEDPVVVDSALGHQARAVAALRCCYRQVSRKALRACLGFRRGTEDTDPSLLHI